jgi:serine protease Do
MNRVLSTVSLLVCIAAAGPASFAGQAGTSSAREERPASPAQVRPGGSRPERSGSAGEERAGARETGLRGLSNALRDLTERLGEAVVQVQTSGYASVQGLGPGGVAAQRGTGSGVILDPQGYIVTNAHVVDAAQRVQVLLPLGPLERRQWQSLVKPRGKVVEARVVGLDLETDLAVLKVEMTNLPALELADSDTLRQGELVLAFGSPLGLENSVSMGVVSAVARQVRPDDPMIYVQTDASINPGNSGGPLVNTDGKVVGINTMIYSQSGGSEGVGFAAPSNIVRHVYQEVRKAGRVRRGQIGAAVQTVTPVLAAGLKLSRDWGVLVRDIVPRGPADFAGLKVGDLVLALDGKAMENARQFDVNLYQRSIGDRIRLDIDRGGVKSALAVSVVERPDDTLRFADLVSRDKNLIPKLGVLALNLDEKLLPSIPPLRKPAGVLVAARVAAAASASEGLLPGDLICTLNGATLQDLPGLKAALELLRSGDAAVLQVQRQGQLVFVEVEVP